MGRKARNRHADAVLMFWMNLSDSDKLECVIEMMRQLGGKTITLPTPQPKRSKMKGGVQEVAPLQSPRYAPDHVVTG